MFLIKIYFVYFEIKVTKREGEKEREGSPHLLIHSPNGCHTRLNQVEAKSLEPYPGFSHDGKGPEDLLHLLLPFPAVIGGWIEIGAAGIQTAALPTKP